MAIKIKLIACKPFLAEYLNVLNSVEVSERGYKVLHYGGSSLSALRKEIFINGTPDLLVTHKKSFIGKLGILQVFHPIESKLDLAQPTRVWTDGPELAKTYYRKIGINVEFIDIKPTVSSRTTKLQGVDLTKLFRRFGEFMAWE